jgi:hypothetical protein
MLQRAQRIAYLVDGHGAGIVLVVALQVHQLRHQGILSAIAGCAWCWGGREVVSVQVECGRRLAFGTFSGHGVHDGPDCGPGEECGGFGVVFAMGRRESGAFKPQQFSVSGEAIFQVSGVKGRKRMGNHRN